GGADSARRCDLRPDRHRQPRDRRLRRPDRGERPARGGLARRVLFGALHGRRQVISGERSVPPRSGPEGLGERLLDRLLAAEPPQALADAGARALAQAAEAQTVAVFLFDEEKSLVEAWHPADAAVAPENAPLRALALSSASTAKKPSVPAEAS